MHMDGFHREKGTRSGCTVKSAAGSRWHTQIKIIKIGLFTKVWEGVGKP